MFRHGYTYSGHPTACAVALANLDLIEREQLVGRVAELEPVLARALAPLAEHPLVADGARRDRPAGRGRDRRGRPRRGPGARAAAGHRHPGARRDHPAAARDVALQISPPFVITEAEIGRIAEAFAGALDAAA